ncbi:MAG TPA: hypothetical protein VGO34_14995 [Alphaproteobacteria bacterium]|jgi:hypothetical protein
MRHLYELTGPGLAPLQFFRDADPDDSQQYLADWTAARAAFVTTGAVNNRYLGSGFFHAIALADESS